MSIVVVDYHYLDYYYYYFIVVVIVTSTNAISVITNTTTNIRPNTIIISIGINIANNSIKVIIITLTPIS